MRMKKKRLAISIVIPLAVGGLAGLLTKDSMKAFAQVEQPPLSPPGWLFPVAWTLLYVLMGIAACLADGSGAPREQIRRGRWTYGIQLAMNFVWPLIFFGGGWYLAAFVWLVGLWIEAMVTAVRFGRMKKAAGYCLIPYLVYDRFILPPSFCVFPHTNCTLRYLTYIWICMSRQCAIPMCCYTFCTNPLILTSITFDRIRILLCCGMYFFPRCRKSLLQRECLDIR